MTELIDLRQLDLPQRKIEAWKYTDLQRLSEGFPPLLPASGEPTGEAAEASLLPDARPLVFIDGCFRPELSDTSMTIHEGETPEFSGELAMLGAAAARRSYRIEVPAGNEQPLHLLYLASADQPRLTGTRLELEIAAGAAGSVVVVHAGGERGLGLLDSHWQLAAGARVELLRLQRLAPEQSLLASQQQTLAAGARLEQVHVDWGSRISRLATTLSLAGAEAEAHYYALAGLLGRQHIDHQVLLSHDAPHCVSRIRSRGIADGPSRLVFNGKVRVARGAQQTDSDQLLRNLLLSDQAEIDAKPELEIYADDVKCAHGSTVGRLDETALFYLRSRGIGAEAARRLLLLSFAEAILDAIAREPWRDRVRSAFVEHLQLALSPEDGADERR